ncbi:MAG: hypothetical protein K1X95_09270 [Acidimicrobiia bacterium]|nr:hypothetical protein [Acidimicrobiia bacterium]
MLGTSKHSNRAARRFLLFGLVLVGGAAIALLSASGAQAAEEWGLITNDPSPCTTVVICVGGSTQSTYDARQDQAITLEAAVCRDDSIFDDCGDIAPGSVSLNGPDTIEVQWDMEGDGVANLVDNNGGSGFGSGIVDDNCPTGTVFYTATYCRLKITVPANTFKPSPPDGWNMQSRICALGGSPCSSWERWSIAGIDTDYDIQCAPGKDNDADGVPCEFEFPGGSVITNNDDRDNDAHQQRSDLKCLSADVAGLPGVDLEAAGNFSAATFLNFCKKQILFFGNPIFTYYQGLFAWADVTIQSGTLEYALANLLTQNGVVTHNADGTVEAYISGLGICTDPSTPGIFGKDVGFCNYQAVIQDDNDFLTQDEFALKVSGRGFFGAPLNVTYGFDGSGNRDAASSLASLAFESFEITPGP